VTLRLIPLLLVLAACSSTTDTGQVPSIGQVGDDLTLLDDFDQGSIDGVWRWAEGDTVERTQQDGAVQLSATGATPKVPGLGGHTSALRTPLNEPHNRVEADFTIDDFESIGGQARGGLGMIYDLGSNSTLMVRVVLRSRDSSGLAVEVDAITCDDSGCQGLDSSAFDFTDFPYDANVDPTTSHHLSLSYNQADQTILAQYDTWTGTIDTTKIPDFDPSGFQFAELSTAGAAAGFATPEARARATVRNVMVDGAPYDAFTGDHLDVSKWQQGDFVRHVQDGELVLAAGASVPDTESRLPLRDFQGVHEIAAKVRVDEYTWTGDDPDWAPVAGLGGIWYDDGTGGDGSGGVAGQVYAGVGVRGGTDVQWMVLRCVSSDCSDHEVLGRGSMGSLDLGTAENLYIGWNGAWFTFQRADAEPVTFNPAEVGYPPAGPPTAGWKGAHVRFPWDGVGQGYVKAAFDDFRTNATGTIDLSVGDTTEAWTTAATSGGDLASLACIGSDPSDDTLGQLHAITGSTDGLSCSGSDCTQLDVTFPTDAELSPGAVLAATVTARTGGGSPMAGSGSITFSEGAFSGSARVKGTFNGTLDDGTAVQASFDAPWIPAATPPDPAASENAPEALDPSCSLDPFCLQSASASRTTWFTLDTSPGDTRTVRLWGGDATATLFDADGTTLCATTVVSGDNLSAPCTGTASGDHLLVAISGYDSAGRTTWSVSEPFTDIEPRTRLSGTLPAGAHHWYRLFGGDPSAAWMVLDYPQDTADADVIVYDQLGHQLLQNGYCCTGSGTLQEYAVPEGNTTGTFWFRVTSEGGAHAYEVEVDPSASGASAPQALSHEIGDNYSSLNLAIGDQATRWVTFTTTANGGAYKLYAESLGPDGGPRVNWTLSTDPDNPTGSEVRTDQGTSCQGAFVSNNTRYEASCWVLLDPQTPYYLALTEQDGVRPTPLAFRIDSPFQDARVVSPDESFGVTVPSGQSANFVAWTDAGKGYNLTMTGSTISATFSDIDRNVLRSMSTNPGKVYGMPLPGSEVQSFTRLELYNFGRGVVDVAPTLETHGTGEQPDEAIQIPLLGNFVEDDVLQAHGQHFFQFQAPQAGQYTIALIGDSYGTMSPVSWSIFTDPTHPGSTTVAFCAPAQNPNYNYRWEAVCSVPLNPGTAYYLKTYEQDGLDGVHYQLIKQ